MTRDRFHLGRCALVALPLVCCLVALATAQEAAKKTDDAQSSPAYSIGPADRLQIVVWKEPDLSHEATVRFDGMVTVPLVGDLPAAGRTPAGLAEGIAAALKRYIEAPQVTVGVVQANSARFYVVGQVTRSGEYPLSGQTTVLQGLALAGGFRDFAKTDSIVIVRRDPSAVPFNFKRIADGKDTSQNVPLFPGDTVVVP